MNGWLAMDGRIVSPSAEKKTISPQKQLIHQPPSIGYHRIMGRQKK
jgi:hypothetical protein